MCVDAPKRRATYVQRLGQKTLVLWARIFGVLPPPRQLKRRCVRGMSCTFTLGDSTPTRVQETYSIAPTLYAYCQCFQSKSPSKAKPWFSLAILPSSGKRMNPSKLPSSQRVPTEYTHDHAGAIRTLGAIQESRHCWRNEVWIRMPDGRLSHRILDEM